MLVMKMDALPASLALPQPSGAVRFEHPVFEGTRDDQLRTACSLFLLGDHLEIVSANKIAEFLPQLNFDAYGRIGKKDFENWKDSAAVQEILQVLENHTVDTSGTPDILAEEMRSRSDMSLFWKRQSSGSRRKRFEANLLPVSLISDVRKSDALMSELRAYAVKAKDTFSLGLGDEGLATLLCGRGVEIRTNIMRMANKMLNNAIVSMVRFPFFYGTT
jgi:hypothetical protein